MRCKKGIFRPVKKVITLLLLFLALFNFVLMVPQNAHAIVASKVGTQVAKKVAKELVQDSAVNTAMDIIFNYQMEQIMSDNYQVDNGYKPVCLDKTPSCSNPAQVKETITDTDKIQIGNKVGEILDRKAGMTGWIKFLDWIVPIFLAATAINWISTVLDPDTEDLFDQVAKEALEETNLIKPIKTTTGEEIVNSDGEPYIDPTNIPSETTNTSLLNYPTSLDLQREIIFSATNNTISEYTINHAPTSRINAYYHLQRNVQGTDSTYATSRLFISDSNTMNSPEFRATIYYGLQFELDLPLADDYSETLYVYKNGSLMGSNSSRGLPYYNVGSYSINQITDVFISPIFAEPIPNNPNKYKLNRIVKVKMSTGDEFKLHATSTFNAGLSVGTTSNLRVQETHTQNISTQLSHRTFIYTDASYHDYVTYKPKLEQLPVSPLDLSIYKTTDGKTNVIPPTAIPIKTPQGTPVKPDPISTTGWINITDGTEITVDEDTLIVEDPVVTPEGVTMPDGTVKPKEEATPDGNLEGTPTPSPPSTDLDQLGTNLPKELIFALLDMLRSILYYMVRLANFILSIPLIASKPIPYEMVQWFFQVEILGIKVMSFVRSMGVFFLSLGLFKILKKVF